MDKQLPWAFLDEYRGKVFSGTWPTIPQMFRITALRYPDRPCFTEYAPDRVSLSYSQAYEKIQKIAVYLRALGLEKDEKIALTGKNSPEWAVAYLTILEAGAVVVPIDYQISMDETKNLIKASDATILFVDEEKAAE
ncbi:MAG: AMP-binding protein, partial [Spirochaetales bacterium]|nr:AMP-binding protein [Spirochaetales bacterium]